MRELQNKLLISAGPLNSGLRKSYEEYKVPLWNGKKEAAEVSK
jgi:hypothetical protein